MVEDLDSKGEWEFLKRSSNPYELVFSQSQDNRIPISVANLRPLSRSFFKMIEILNVLDFFKRHSGTIRSAHACEGPGGFIEALLHLAAKNSMTVENAWAATLRPTKQNIPGWKRAYHFLKKNPNVRVEYGADDTGDIMIPANQQSFLRKTAGKCMLFTADGGFDFSEHYSTQEDEVFPLLVSSALLGLQSMVKGGDFVLKVFDTDLLSTQHLIAILSHCFDDWTLYKPALSRPCNAEKYFLGRGCRFVPKCVINILTEIRDEYAKGFNRLRLIFPVLPAAVKENIAALREEFLKEQVVALENTFLNKDTWNKNSSLHWREIQEHSIHWCQHFQIPIKPFTNILTEGGSGRFAVVGLHTN